MGRTWLRAWDFIVRCNIRHLPVDPEEVFLQRGWYLIPSKEAARRYRKPDPAGLRKMSADAITGLLRQGYITIFDETQIPERIRWTLAHEIGHIVLGHLEDFDATSLHRGGLSGGQYQVLEREADIFAAELLAPMPILTALGTETADIIAAICRLSRQAAANRERDVKWHAASANRFWQAEALRRHFEPFLSTVPVCSNAAWGLLVALSHTRAKGDMYPVTQKLAFVDTDPQGRFLTCPRCGNSEFAADASYCKLCGLYLFNECSDASARTPYECGKRNDGDARYCEWCGAETLLLRQGLLMTWGEVVAAHREIAAALSSEKMQQEDAITVPATNEIPF